MNTSTSSSSLLSASLPKLATQAEISGLKPRARQWLWPWLLAVTALANMAYSTYVHYDFSHSLDTRSYLRLASGRFDSVQVTRRYRLLVPVAAAAVAAPLAQAYARIWPQRPAGQWPLRFAFYVVNCCLLAAGAACWYNAARLSGASTMATTAAMLAVLTSRWASYAAGLPLTDSLYILVFSLAYYAVRRGPGGGWALAAALVLGPLAKESFVFLVPWLVCFGRPALSWSKQAIYLTGGVLCLAAVHYFVDARANASTTESLSNAWDHLHNVTYSLERAFSLKGAGELLSIFGFFALLVPLACGNVFRQRPSNEWRFSFGRVEGGLLTVIAIHMTLSGDLGRMGYLAAPAFCTALALIFTHWRRVIAA